MFPDIKSSLLESMNSFPSSSDILNFSNSDISELLDNECVNGVSMSF